MVMLTVRMCKGADMAKVQEWQAAHKVWLDDVQARVLWWFLPAFRERSKESTCKMSWDFLSNAWRNEMKHAVRLTRRAKSHSLIIAF